MNTWKEKERKLSSKKRKMQIPFLIWSCCWPRVRIRGLICMNCINTVSTSFSFICRSVCVFPLFRPIFTLSTLFRCFHFGFYSVSSLVRRFCKNLSVSVVFLAWVLSGFRISAKEGNKTSNQNYNGIILKRMAIKFMWFFFFRDFSFPNYYDEWPGVSEPVNYYFTRKKKVSVNGKLIKQKEEKKSRFSKDFCFVTF